MESQPTVLSTIGLVLKQTRVSHLFRGFELLGAVPILLAGC